MFALCILNFGQNKAQLLLKEKEITTTIENV